LPPPDSVFGVELLLHKIDAMSKYSPSKRALLSDVKSRNILDNPKSVLEIPS